jgi:xanthine dehydrogenase small subunit
MSLNAYFLSTDTWEYADAVRAVDGNICRCTGYASIKRAIRKVCDALNATDPSGIFEALMSHQIIPRYFHDIPEQLKMIKGNIDVESTGISKSRVLKSRVLVAGGTDLYVQRPDALIDKDIQLIATQERLNRIWQDGRYCYIGAGATIEEIRESGILKKQISRIDDYLLLFASTPIRNQATLGGNLINASPIGDTTIFFLALDAWICLSNEKGKRELKLKDFYLDYKKMDKDPDDILEYVKFPFRGPSDRFNYEKVSKRTWLDIASVNSAIAVRVEDDVILDAHLSAGGVSPVPLFLSKTSEYLKGKKIDGETVISACATADSEISPISDVRGSEAYKRLLLKQLIIAHFKVLFPDKK